MTGHRDTRPANWKKKITKFRRWMAELQAEGVICIEPPDFDVPPHQRIAEPSTVDIC
jgi:hypothetical protein